MMCRLVSLPLSNIYELTSPSIFHETVNRIGQIKIICSFTSHANFFIDPRE